MKRLIMFLTILILSQSAKAQNIAIDLSKREGTTFSQTIQPRGISTVTILNRLARKDAKYSISVEKMTMPIPNLPHQDFLGNSDNVCDSLIKAIKKLDAEKEEANIPSAIATLQAEIKKTNKENCNSTITEAHLTIASTRQVIVLPDSMVVDKGEMVKITVKRDDKTWIYEFRTEQVNPWKVYFGFTYVPDVLSKFNNYYAKQDTGSTYLINKMNGDNKNTLRNISPTVMFTYRFYKKEDQPAKFGLTGGFMYNLETLGAMFGPSLVIGDNLSINTGLAFVQKDKLRGQYMEGQRLKETLDFNQLHEKVWTYDMFVSIAFNIPGLFKKLGEKEKPATAE